MKLPQTTQIQKGMTTEFTPNGVRIHTWVEKGSYTGHQNKINQFQVSSPPSHSFSLLHQMPSSYLLLTLYSSSNPFQNSLAYIHWRTSISFKIILNPWLNPELQFTCWISKANDETTTYDYRSHTNGARILTWVKEEFYNGLCKKIDHLHFSYLLPITSLCYVAF